MRISEEKGFSLTEVIITAFILTMAIGGMMAFYTMGQKTWKDGNTRADVQRQARIALDVMVRGAGGTDGIREASSVSLPNTSTIRYISGIDAVERSFYLSGTDVFYDPDTGSGGDEYKIADDVRASPPGLVFALNGSVVTIEIYTEDQVAGRTLGAALSTKVNLRN
ncbi:MAG: hypothetical protein ABIG55_00375 [Candidatus Omnitrophota bacterium]|nr:hypothetical protein [Candidatus Omnitrophota bacterium]